LPREFVFEREEDFLRACQDVEPKYVTAEDLLVRAFFKSWWWICVFEAQAKTSEDLVKLKSHFVEKGFAPITVRESPLKIL